MSVSAESTSAVTSISGWSFSRFSAESATSSILSEASSRAESSVAMRVGLSVTVHRLIDEVEEDPRHELGGAVVDTIPGAGAAGAGMVHGHLAQRAFAPAADLVRAGPDRDPHPR